MPEGNLPELIHLAEKARSKKRDFKIIARRLKKMNAKKLDELIGHLHDEAFSEVGCLDCANCCSSLGPRLLPKDIERLSARLKMKSNDFMQAYLKKDEDGDLVFRSMPCPFLMPDKLCMVYESRPKACKEYPHTDQKNIRSILSLCVKNTETCPVVYRIFEELED